MNASKEPRRMRRHRQPSPEALETRVVMSSGQGSTFAITPGSLTTSGQIVSIPFKIDPTLFSAPKGRFVLGIDIAPATPTSSGTTTNTAAFTTPGRSGSRQTTPRKNGGCRQKPWSPCWKCTD